MLWLRVQLARRMAGITSEASTHLRHRKILQLISYPLLAVPSLEVLSKLSNYMLQLSKNILTESPGQIFFESFVFKIRKHSGHLQSSYPLRNP